MPISVSVNVSVSVSIGVNSNARPDLLDAGDHTTYASSVCVGVA